MARKTAQYSVTIGLSGCYMPDAHYGATEFRTRGELADYIRHEIEFQEFPKNSYAQVKIMRLWRYIQRYGSSSAHFSIEHDGREIAFHGLTNAEYEAAQNENN